MLIEQELLFLPELQPPFDEARRGHQRQGEVEQHPFSLAHSPLREHLFFLHHQQDCARI